MYFNFDDRHPDVSGLDRAMSWREGVLLSIVLHLAGTILIMLAPQLFPVGKPDASDVDKKMALMRQRENEARRFVFVQPRAEFDAMQKPKGQDLSDRDRATQSPESAPKPLNMQPFSRGNTFERIDRPSVPAPPQMQAPRDMASPGQPAPGPDGSKVQEDSTLRGLTGPAPLPRMGAGGTAGDRLGEAIRNAQKYAPPQLFDNSQGGGQFGSAIQFDTKGVEFGPWVRRFIAQIKRNWFIPQAAMALKGHVVVTFVVHKDGSITELGVAGPCPVDAFNNSSFNAIATSNPTQPLPPDTPTRRRASPSRSSTTSLRRIDDDRAESNPTARVVRAAHAAGRVGRDSRQRRTVNGGCPDTARVLVAVLGPTASGKSALGLALAKRFGGEIVSCDSTAVYEGFEIGTDKVPLAEQQGIPHHLVDSVEPACEYTAADYARDAMAAIEDIGRRGRLPILVGGTGFYYRALVRGLFPGPPRDPAIRARLERIASRAGVERLHRWLARVDPPSAQRIQSRDLVRIVRALEVYLKSGKPLTQHFADTRAPLEGWAVVGLAVAPTWAEITERIARRVEIQFMRGIVDEVRLALARGVPDTARPFSGYVYRRVLEHVRGERDEDATRELIVRENRHYARRQLIWFRKEPNLEWIHGAGERDASIDQAERAICARLGLISVPGPYAENATHGPDF